MVAHLLQHDRLQTAQRAVGDLDEIAGVKAGAYRHDIDRLARPLLELLDDGIIDRGGVAAKADDPDNLRRVLHRSEILGQIQK